MTSDTTIFIAFVAGIVSFLAPCVIPIIPGFLSYLAGSSLSEASNKRLPIFMNSLFFVLGFSSVFAALGVLLNTLLSDVAYDTQIWMSRIGGVVIIFFGLYLVGLIKPKFLQREHKLQVKTKFKSRYLTSFVFGAAFAAGWTPCVGAVLGGVLALAATQPGSAFALLLAYAIGLGIPFLIMGLFAAQASSWIHKYSKYLKSVNIVFGFILIILGILIFTNNLARIANFEILNNLLLN
ncbi:sulfite exporter TauE/SafE family protein [Candidatus Pacearchaeota archaeon]|nr:sulfite exporter TauE/SafE family protein [Candidatus Pacearchaeota archaeon]